MTLALLLTVTTGAWADELSESFTTNHEVSVYTGEHFKITVGDVGSGKGFYLAENKYATIEALNGEIITKVELTKGYYYINNFYCEVGTTNISGDVATVSGVNNTSLTFTASGALQIKAVKVYYTAAEPPIEVAWNASTKTGTFYEPGSDVVLTPIYAPTATWAEVESVKQLPAAAEGVIAGTDAPLIVEGIVAFAGETKNPQGTVMYAVTPATATEAPALTAFSADVPTATDIADDGADVLVWYYIQGADAPDGQQATADNTFNNSEVASLNVSVRSNKFDLALNAANANNIEAGMATVTVGGNAATVTDGKLQGVKMGSEVKMTTAQGYKFRKVEVKKKAAAKPLANATTEDLGKVVGADGKIYATKAAAEAANTTAVAMICYVNEGHGLALALSDISSYGNSWDNSSTNNEGKTAAELCSAWNTSKAVTGATWKLASLSEMNLMINAAGGYAALRDGFSAVGGTNMIDDYYWVSDESSADYAKNYNFGGGYDMQEFKDNSYQVRACLAF